MDEQIEEMAAVILAEVATPETAALVEEIKPKRVRKTGTRKPKTPAPKHYRGFAENWIATRHLTRSKIEAAALKLYGEKPGKSARVVRIKRGKQSVDIPVRNVGRSIGLYHPNDLDIPKSGRMAWTGDVQRAFERLNLNVVNRKEEAAAALKRKKAAKKRVKKSAA